MAVFMVSVGALLTGLGLLAPVLSGWAFSTLLEISDSFAHFRLPLIGLTLLGAGLVWLVGRRQMALFGIGIAALAVLLSAPHLPFLGPPAQGAGAYKLIQLNVWFGNWQSDKTVAWILSEKPDVVTMQEYGPEKHPALAQLSNIMPHQAVCRSQRLGSLVVWSRFAITKSFCTAGSGLMRARLDMNGRTVDVVSLHLDWPWPRKQAEQLARLDSALSLQEVPTIVAGDFNAAPWSGAVKRVERLTGSTAIGGYRITLWMDVRQNGKPWPALPIDHVLMPPGFSVRSVRTGPLVGSDHRPVVVEFDG